ncbi:MAG: hypothetical protein AB1898_27020 [Acidobacteriota bacterium]
MSQRVFCFISAMVFALLGGRVAPAQESTQLKVRLSWGHQSPVKKSFYVKILSDNKTLETSQITGYQTESGESAKEGAWQTSAGAGDVDGIEFLLSFPKGPEAMIQDLHVIWADLIAQSDSDTSRRLSEDAAFTPASPKLTIQTNAEGTEGFSVAVSQLLRNPAMWIPSLDLYLATGKELLPFEDHLKELASWKGKRVLDQIQKEPEASYEQYTARWEDMGHPGYRHPRAPEPGHIVGLTWDSAIPKFGVDRAGGVWNDYGNPDRFRFWFEFGDLNKGVESSWKSQSLQDGLPIITTVFERDGLRYELEQFAYPLDGPPSERRGNIAMLLLQKVRLTNLESRARSVPVSLVHRRVLSTYLDSNFLVEERAGSHCFRIAGNEQTVLSIQAGSTPLKWSGVKDYQREQKRLNATLFLELASRGSSEFVVKLPSPAVEAKDLDKLVSLDYSKARSETVRFWSDYVAHGAQFRVPEKVVNDLYRATLWHALRLPRRHGGESPEVQIDLPYSNFAYSQTGTPWPINQAVYVDYMLYDLRGYHSVSAEELLVMYRNNQEATGHINGYANWVVYTPGMLYSVAKNFLLSGDRELLDRLLPSSLKAMDWCLAQIRAASRRAGPSSGLVDGPLNDGTGDGVWAFNQAYLYAGLDLFGQVLKRINHPRADECLRMAESVRQATARAFGDAARRSTLVQLRDHTWVPYVPCEALTPRRILDQWYVTDTDTGAMHLLRLKALDPKSNLADFVLNDHEDNLYLNGWGIANEPVYNPQSTAYLHRDNPKAAIRGFYSYMASAFSHSTLEPVEHRWTHGQYFGPPSTDGAWFELYRQMLIQEGDDGALLLAQATPRKWLENGQKIEIERAPTYYGTLSATLESQAASGRILATVQMPQRSRPKSLLVRLRHPEERPIRSVTVNDSDWKDFDVEKEWVRIKEPTAGQYRIVVQY